MIRYQLDLKALEPLVITDGSSESMAHQTLDYIPGNMLLGAMAGQWLRTGGQGRGRPDDDPEFQNLFLDGSVLWGHGYPRLGHKTCLPIPLSFQKIKNSSGLPLAEDDEEGPERRPPVVNALHWQGNHEDLARMCPDQPRPKLKKCEPGFMDSVTFQRPGLETVWNMHVALDQRGRNAAKGLLFGYSALAPGAVFQSEIWLRPEVEPVFLGLMEKTNRFQVGHSRSAGYGTVELEKLSPAETAAPPEPEGKTWTVFLVSDFLSRLGRNPLEALLEDLAPFIGPADRDHLSLFGDHLVINGFNNLWRLPRSGREALAKGSVIHFQTKGGPTTALDELPPALGAGTVEGYGRFLLNPPFLREAIIHGQSGPAPSSSPSAVPNIRPDNGVLLRLMRSRALEREARRLVAEKMAEAGLTRFIRSAAESPVSQSQRGNLRRLISSRPPGQWLQVFESWLEKTTVLSKWRSRAANPPYGSGPIEHLDAIMKELLRQERVQSMFSRPDLRLPGGPALDPAEDDGFKIHLHRHFLLELLKAWEKQARSLPRSG